MGVWDGRSQETKFKVPCSGPASCEHHLSLLQPALCNHVSCSAGLPSPAPRLGPSCRPGSEPPALTQASVNINNQMSPISQAAADSRVLKVNSFF